MKLRLLTPVVAIGVLITCGAAHGITAADVVRKAQSAESRVSYRGSKAACIVVDGRSVCSQMRVLHLKPGMTRTEYYSPKLLKGTVVTQRGGRVWRYSPDKGKWEEIRSFAPLPSKVDPHFALSNYDVRLAPSQTVLGRKAYVVVASPRRAWEAFRRLWVDMRTFVILKTQVEKPAGRVISSTAFTEIALNPQNLSAAAFAVPGTAKPCSMVGDPGFVVAKPKYLPKGYRQTGQCCEKVGGHNCVHLQYSNGVNTVSLFERNAGVDCARADLHKRLPNMMTWKRQGLIFTLVGDLPQSELQKISNSTK